MYVVINKEKMTLLYRHTSKKVLADICWIESEHFHLCVFEDTHAEAYEQFTAMELHLLHKSLCGIDPATYYRPSVIAAIIALAVRVEPLKANMFELASQAAAITDMNKGFYKYIPGQLDAEELNELFEREGCRATLAEPLHEAPVVVYTSFIAPVKPAVVAATQQNQSEMYYPPPWIKK